MPRLRPSAPVEVTGDLSAHFDDGVLRRFPLHTSLLALTAPDNRATTGQRGARHFGNEPHSRLAPRKSALPTEYLRRIRIAATDGERVVGDRCRTAPARPTAAGPGERPRPMGTHEQPAPPQMGIPGRVGCATASPRDRDWMAEVIDRPVADHTALYAAQRAASLVDVAKGPGSARCACRLSATPHESSLSGSRRRRRTFRRPSLGARLSDAGPGCLTEWRPAPPRGLLAGP